MIRRSSALTWYGILLAIAAILLLLLPANTTALHLLHISAQQYKVAAFTLILPYAIIWFSAFYAYAKLQQYAKRLETTRENEAFRQIATGVQVLAWGLPIPFILSLIFSMITDYHPSFKPAQTITDNYIALLVPLVGFTIIGNGTRLLTEIVKVRPSLWGVRIFALIFITLGVLFSHFVVHNHNRGGNPYYLPVYVLIITFIIPYLFIWFNGLLSAYELQLYAQKIKGVFYTQILRKLAGGFAIVIGGSILLQYVAGVYASKSSADFNTVLFIVYSLLVIQAAGYALIALGAKQLMRIEEV